MKELKIKAWDKKRKRMSIVKSIRFDFNQNITSIGLAYFPEEGGNYFSTDKPKDVILLLSTGLKDKNKKEIYEGDIVKGTFEGNKGVGFIEYDDRRDATFYVELVINDLVETQPHHLNNDCEVIGNMFENQELLK